METKPNYKSAYAPDLLPREPYIFLTGELIEPARFVRSNSFDHFTFYLQTEKRIISSAKREIKTCLVVKCVFNTPHRFILENALAGTKLNVEGCFHFTKDTAFLSKNNICIFCNVRKLSFFSAGGQIEKHANVNQYKMLLDNEQANEEN
jgi:hypothetical protein